MDQRDGAGQFNLAVVITNAKLVGEISVSGEQSLTNVGQTLSWPVILVSIIVDTIAVSPMLNSDDHLMLNLIKFPFDTLCLLG